MIPSADRRYPLPLRALLAALAGVLCLLVPAYHTLLLQWPMLREAHYLHYIGFLLNEFSLAPYRDVLETSWFGTFLFHMAVGKVFGYSATGFRWADILLSLALLGITWSIMRHLHRLLAWVAGPSAILAYLHFGPANTLQRDYLILLPLATALWLAVATRPGTLARAALVGACLAAAATIKPHALIGMPVIFTLLYRLAPAHERSVGRLLAACTAGGSLLFGAGLAWLALRGGLGAFVDMSLHYLPLYQDLNGAHEMTTPAQRLANTLHWWKIFTWGWPTVIVAGLAWCIVNTRPASRERDLAFALAALALCYNLYPLLAGKFWDYHWIPYTYFAVLAACTLLLPPATGTRGRQLLAALACLYFIKTMLSLYFPWNGLIHQAQRYPDITVDTSYDREIAGFIRRHLQPGDTIQVIDQGGPTTQYLLLAEARLATRYVGSFLFLHHIDQPYVQAAQRDFIAQLERQPPRLFMVMTDFTRPSGPGTMTAIPGLQAFLETHYEPLWETPAFRFWQRREGQPGTRPTE